MLTRSPAVAGAFYPSDPSELKEQIRGYLQQAASNPKVKKLLEETKKRNIRALIVPHAGYVYSAPIAASAYSFLEERNYNRVVLLGPAHTYPISRPTLPESEIWETPLGKLNIEQLPDNCFQKSDPPHIKEHCLEVQLPFLQILLKQRFTILPILTGDTDPRKIAELITPLLDDKTLLVISSDLSHYKSYDEAKIIDSNTIQSVLNLDSNELLETGDACGIIPIAVAINIAKKLSWEIKLVDSRSSGDTAGDKEAVVGYASFVLYE